MNGNLENMQTLSGRIKSLAIDTTLTKKGMCAEAKATGEALATKVNITDIVDDLTSVADDKPLSANQGRILKKQIDEIDPHYAENVIYDDTNVKDAIDKLSKAENIAYDEEKSVQGAIDEVSDNVADVQTQINEVQVINLKEGATLYVNGKVGLIRFTGIKLKNGSLLIENDKAKYRPIISSSNGIRIYDGGTGSNPVKFYDSMVTLMEDGTIGLSYVPSQGASSSITITSDTSEIYGTVMYIIK